MPTQDATALYVKDIVWISDILLKNGANGHISAKNVFEM